MLTYLPGEVPAKWRQFPDDQVSAAARIVRDLHDRTTHSTLTAASSVVCHNDLGPNNFVFRNGSPIALIDYDMAAPGERLEDLGYMAWAWCLSSKATRGSVRSQAQQVLVLADAYGLSAAERGLLPDAIIKRQRRNTQFWRAYLTQQTEPAISTPEHVRDVIAWSNTEMSHTIVHRDVLLATLKPLSRAKR
ncbi:MAG: phosphotransferase [Polyangiales bacterium]